MILRVLSPSSPSVLAPPPGVGTPAALAWCKRRPGISIAKQSVGSVGGKKRRGVGGCEPSASSAPPANGAKAAGESMR